MFVGNINRLAGANDNFRQVLETGEYSQVVAMSLPVGGDIGEEVHENTDQLFLIAEGDGQVLVGNETRGISEGDFIVVPAGTVHNVTNTGDEDLKLLTIYAPPEHPEGTVQKTREKAERV